MMTPLQFERLYEKDWAALDAQIALLSDRSRSDLTDAISAARTAALYRRACEHLALARARAYPTYMIDRLEGITTVAHQLIYNQRELGGHRLRRLLTSDFPAAVRAHSGYVALAAAAFLLPTLIVGLLVHRQPEMILSVVSPETAAQFEDMYSPDAESLGRTRDAETDWVMFGYYIRNNIGVSFQCFAGGLFVGVGSLFFLVYNGAFSGALAGYLVGRGLGAPFFSFVATHSAFELTAIVIAGAAGLRLGHALLAPGRVPRRQALIQAAHGSVVLLYGVTAMLLIAATVEAFWSSATWLDSRLKYGVAAACWSAVGGYFLFQGRRAG